jgi:hypothetical protein
MSIKQTWEATQKSGGFEAEATSSSKVVRIWGPDYPSSCSLDKSQLSDMVKVLQAILEDIEKAEAEA